MRKKSELTERLVPDRCQEALYNEMMTALGRIAEEHMLPGYLQLTEIMRKENIFTLDSKGDIFLSTKLRPSEYENGTAVEETLERLGVDYADLLYIYEIGRGLRRGFVQL